MSSNNSSTRLRPRRSANVLSGTISPEIGGPVNRLNNTPRVKRANIPSPSTRNRSVKAIAEQLKSDVLFYNDLAASSKEGETVRLHASTRAAEISDILARAELRRFRTQELKIQQWSGQASKKRSLLLKNVADLRAYLSKNNCSR